MARRVKPAAPLNPTYEGAAKIVRGLVDDFEKDERYYLSSAYNEAQARKDFIDKFLIAFGWDVNHDQQTNPYEQEVKVERGVATGVGQRRADYAFYLAPNFHDVRFLVEAKKPFMEIGTKENYFQLIRYGWNSDTPLAVLTDFEQFHVLDCRYKPDLDSALNRAVAKYHYSDYTKREKFAEIYWLFSHEAVASGSLEKRAKQLPKPRGKARQRGLFPGGYQSIDESFLAELDQYRTSLARNFKNRNPKLDSETLTELAQRTLDRLVFLRFLEDKGIEAQRLVERFGDKGTAWEDFIAASRRLDGIYNGIVYKHHDILDGAKFRVDDHAFADICESLAHINSPYDFNAIPIHILGSIYERFLGKVIVATDKRVKVVDKPEVRKAGGVYYTPEYIVRYIVENTVGKLIAGKTPNQIAEMRFADIACGSGSFLLAVFELLLNYHGHYYNENPGKARKRDCIQRDGRLYLSLRKKREILLNNVYGVDIDAQAVEVCQLSLYLKLLQEETEASAHQYLLDFAKQALLPSLDKNIVCGNSLIGMDILDGQLFASDEERKLNPMNFEDAFPEVMQHGGFDAIVGNPPYVRPHNLTPQMKKLLWARYKTFIAKSDLYSCFMERGLSLTRNDGLFGFIVPQTWTSLESFTAIRKFIIQNARVRKIVQLPKKVFAKATVETCIFVFQRSSSKPNISANTVTVECLTADAKPQFVREFPQKSIEEAYLNNFQLYGKDESRQILAKVKVPGKPLGEFVRFLYGFKTADDQQFIHKRKRYKESKLFIRSAAIHPYYYDPPCEYVWYVPDSMRQNADTARPGEAARFESEKILVSRMGKSLVATYDRGGLYVKDAMLLLPQDGNHSLKYLLGVINSRVLNFFYQEFFVTIDVLKNALLSLPIHEINFSDAIDKSRHDEIVGKVEAMLEAKKQLAKAQTDKHKTYYEKKCAALDRQIDRLVYDLYSLTDEDIKIVERATAVSPIPNDLPVSAAVNVLLPKKKGRRQKRRPEDIQGEMF
ncbi:MAG: N-6 DNA methylase [Planctomycetota bacterium]